jgi:CheY-like chemotaxis protein
MASTVLGGFAAGAAGRMRLGGPPVGLAPPAARLLALVLFELATNAVKHGALRRPGGRVRLDWTRGADGDLYLRWRETPAPGEAALSAGGPAGGGSALFDGLAADLGGRFRRIPFAAGFAAEIVLPACHLVETPRNAAAPEGPSTAQSPTPAVEAAPEDPRPARPRRVLVVEDNALIADDLTDMLRREGVGEVVVALSAQEARAALEGEGFDLVLLDVALGDGSAESLLPQLGAARVLLVSGRSVEDMPAALRGLPLLPKPFLPADLARVLG